MKRFKTSVEEDEKSEDDLSGEVNKTQERSHPLDSSTVVEATEVDLDAYRDQGFTRPRVLVLCPFRGTAKAIVEKLTVIMGPNTSVAGMERLMEEFGPPEESDVDEEELGLSAEAARKRAKARAAAAAAKDLKPADWQTLFDQNMDDDFKVI
jgi:hypothetical protein